MLIDLHARTEASTPGAPSAHRVLEVAKERRLGGVAFVESLRSTTARTVLAASEAVGLPAYLGVEIPTTVGRFLCFAPEIDPFLSREEWRQIMAGGATPTYEALFRMFDGLGGAVLAAQPYDRNQGARLADRVAVCEGLHGVELMTSTTRRTEVVLATEASVKLGLPGVAGSDTSADLDDIGAFATLFAEEIQSQAELCAALRGGNFWAVSMGEPLRAPRRDSSRRPDEGEGRGRDGDSRGRGRGRGRDDSSSRRGDRGGGRSRRPRGRGDRAGSKSSNGKGEQS